MESVAATQFIRDDHKHLRGLLRQFEAVEVRAPEMADGVMKQMMMEIEIHSALEEEIFYPAMERSVDPNLASLAAGSRSGHVDIKQEIDYIRHNPDLTHREMRIRLLKVKHLVDEHMNDEERSLLPLAEAVMGVDLYDLGAQMLERKLELMKQPQYQDAQPEIVQNPKGGEQMRHIRRAS